MAKIHARGCSKLTSAFKVRESDEHGYIFKDRRALRSDGAVLRALDMKRDGETRFNAGHYSIQGKLRADVVERGYAAMIEVFEKFYGDRDWTIKRY